MTEGAGRLVPAKRMHLAGERTGDGHALLPAAGELEERLVGLDHVVHYEPAAAVTDCVWPGMGVVEPVDDDSCLLHLGADAPVASPG